MLSVIALLLFHGVTQEKPFATPAECWSARLNIVLATQARLPQSSELKHRLLVESVRPTGEFGHLKCGVKLLDERLQLVLVAIDQGGGSLGPNDGINALTVGRYHGDCIEDKSRHVAAFELWTSWSARCAADQAIKRSDSAGFANALEKLAELTGNGGNQRARETGLNDATSISCMLGSDQCVGDACAWLRDLSIQCDRGNYSWRRRVADSIHKLDPTKHDRVVEALKAGLRGLRDSDQVRADPDSWTAISLTHAIRLEELGEVIPESGQTPSPSKGGRPTYAVLWDVESNEIQRKSITLELTWDDSSGTGPDQIIDIQSQLLVPWLKIAGAQKAEYRIKDTESDVALVEWVDAPGDSNAYGVSVMVPLPPRRSGTAKYNHRNPIKQWEFQE